MGDVDNEEDSMLGLCIGDESASDDSDSLASEITMDQECDDDETKMNCATTGENVLLNKEDLGRFIERFHCANCRAPVRGVQFQTVGIATRVSYICYRCKKKEISIQPEMVTTNHTKQKSPNFVKKYHPML